jgi:drug/metabolite transporter (DMT)-like permease
MSRRPTFLIVAVTVALWGSSFPAIRAALTFYTPTHLAAFRFLIAALALGILLAVKGFPHFEVRDLPVILINGVVGVGCYNLFLNTGQLTVDAGAASLLVNTAPLWTMLWAVIFLNERPSWMAWLGLLVSFAGVALIALRHGGHLEINRGALMVVGAAFCHSIYIVLMKRNVARYGAIGATTFAVWAGALFLMFFSGGLIQNIQEAPLHSTLIVIYLGLAPAALAYVLWAEVLKRFPASTAVSFLYFVPVTAFIIAWLWLGESPTWNTVCGGVLIISGVVLVNREKA